jgi:hypothetical protein
MSVTNENFLSIDSKKILGTVDFRDRLFGYLKGYAIQNASSIFDIAARIGTNTVELSSGGTDRVTVEEPGSEGNGVMVDGLGHFIKPSEILDAHKTVYFENENAVVYNISVSYCDYPVDVATNPRNGYPNYTAWKEYVGLKAEPSSVTDNGDGTITFGIPTSMLENGVDNGGRKVKAFLKVPDQNGTTIEIASEELTVSYSGGFNTITTSSNSLGQITISTTASDYWLVLVGPCVWRNFDPLSGSDTHAFVGTVTGAGSGVAPSTLSTANQIIVPQTLFSAFALGLEQDFLPKTDNTYNLGSASKRWATVFLQNLDIVNYGSDIIPDTDDTYDLGDNTHYWSNVYARKLNIDSLASPDSEQSMISSGLWETSFGSTIDSNNIIDAGSTVREFRDQCVYFTSDSRPRLLVANNSGLTIEVWDARTRSLVETTSTLADDLPSGSSETWEVCSIMTDGTYLYGLFIDTNASPNTYQIQAWEIATWDVKGGWASTGTSLPGTGSPFGGGKGGEIIKASSTKLATYNSWIDISASSSTAITIIDITDGSIDASGAGDAPTGDSVNATNICSDGTNVFFTGYGSSSNTYLCSATIADPTAGCGGSNFPLTDTSTSYFTRLVSCGPNLMFCAMTNATTAILNNIRTFNSSNADLDILQLGQNSASTPLLGNKWVLKNPSDLVFDGINVWILGGIENNGTGDDQAVLVKIDVAKLALIDTNVVRQLGDVASGVFILAANTVLQSYTYPSVSFDGRDIWGIIEPTSLQTASGKIFRLPFAKIRN